MRSKTLIIIAASLLILFVLLSKYEDRQVLRTLDFTATVRVQDAVGRLCGVRCDAALESVGFFASPAFSVIAVAALTLFAAFDRKKKRFRPQALVIPLLFVLLTLVEIYGKSIVRHPAPPFFMLKNPTTIFPTYHVFEEFSYPSGHAARAVFFAVLLWSRNPRVMVGLSVYVGLIVASRVYLGQHWLSDTVGGVFLGAGVGLFAWLLTGRNKSPIIAKQ
jgi:membrane-associated phospholipid phosphatase